jgi:fermentation-respiration switch protein FrsA (DUF1100 family)
MPVSEVIDTPEKIGLRYEKARIQTEDGIELTAWFIPAWEEGSGSGSGLEDRKVVLFCHGNAGNISDRLDSIEIFHRLGLGILIFDYRGYGESQGTPSETGLYLDTKAAWDYLTGKIISDEETVRGNTTSGKNTRQIFSPDQIIVFGRSLGGSAASWLAGEATPRALVLESSFLSVGDLAASFLPFLPVKALVGVRHDTVRNLARVRCPVLIIHSREDELVPFSHGSRLFEKANNPKMFLQIEGKHNAGFITDRKRYESGLRSFLAQI